MKWGQVIRENIICKWHTCYISYNALKQIIKKISTAPSAARTSPNAAKLKLTFATILETDVFKVNSFFNHHEETLRKHYDLLMKHWKNHKHQMSYGIVHGLGMLLAQLKELQHYAFINAEGFRKIIKKYDKRMVTTIGQTYYPSLQKYRFYTRECITQMIETISHILNTHKAKEHQSYNTLHLDDNIASPMILTHSIRSNKHEMIESIIEHFDHEHYGNTLTKMINSKDGKYLGNTALMTCCAAVSGSLQIAQLLIEYGADISVINNYCRTALHIAAQRGHNDMIKLLLKVMKDTEQTHLIHEVDVDMHNALHLACLRKHYASCQLLIAFDDTIVNEPNADGITALMLICDGVADDENDEQLMGLMNILLQCCADINQRDWKFQSALHYACISGNKVCVDMLLKHKGMDAFVFDWNGQSPVHVAASHGHVDIVKRICEYSNAIYDRPDNKGRTALHLCTARGHKPCTQYLLGIGADATILDNNGCNAHSYALYNGNWNDEDCPRQVCEETKEEAAKHRRRGSMMYSTQRQDVSYMDSTNTKVDLMVPSASLIGKSGCVVKFRIQCDTRTKKDYLCIVGDCNALGNWDVTKGVKMYRNKMPEQTAAVLTEDESQSDDAMSPRNAMDKSSITTTTWIADILLAKGSAIKYRYIIRRQSCNSLESYEALPRDRKAMIHESMIIDDGVFGIVTSKRSKSTTSIARISSVQSMRPLHLMGNANSFDSDEDIGSTPTPQPQAQQTSYIESGWLVNDAQLQIQLGHNTYKQQRAPLVINNNLYIDRITIRSGYINQNRYRGIRMDVSLPNEQQKVYKLQSNYKQIAALCSLEFELFTRGSRDALCRVFVLPSQILSNCTGALTLPLSSANGLLIGEFNFEYILITPFTHQHCGNILFKTFAHQHAWSRKAIVIGHRGTGSHTSAELPGPRRTHIKENTILAFATAESFGADCVEFDVQLTKDKTPIIYHDFLFDAGAFNIPINKITFDELKRYNQESNTLNEAHDTMNMNMKQFNSFLEDHICSLRDVFKLAPIHLGLNIEIKYPLYEECIADGIECSVDLNEYVDRILSCVFDNHHSNRYIIFSSFHPDICIALALKQPQFAVLFLTESGKSWYYDVRCRSLKNAIYFAKTHSLFGIVTDVKPIAESPHLIRVVHKNGLILLTYGQMNNDKNMIDLQMKHGIDGLISDHVQYVRQHLDSKRT